MDNIIDLIATDAKPSEVSDQIKDALYSKAAEKIEGIRPNIALSMFSEPTESESEVEPEPEEESTEND